MANSTILLNNSRLFAFLKEEKMTDVTLTAAGKMIKAHKLILASASKYFEDLFTTLGDQHPVVVLKDIPVRQLLLVLEYIYLGKCNLEPADVKEFKRVAACLEIKVELNFPDEDRRFMPNVSSSHEEDEEDYDNSYEEIMESRSVNFSIAAVRSVTGMSFNNESEPPTKKIRIKQETVSPMVSSHGKIRATPPSKTSPQTSTMQQRDNCPHCDREMGKREINYHSRHCWKNADRIESICTVCKRAFELPSRCRAHEKKEHGLHINTK